jgi:hypothetical protein
MKVHRGSRDTAPLILNLGTRRSGRFTSAGRTRVPTEQQTEWTQSRGERLREEKNLLPLPGFELQTIQPVAYYGSLQQLR